MSNIRKETIERMKADLLSRVDEWIGIDIPAEGSEDYESWQSKLAEIDGIENIQGVIDYVEGEGFDLDDFFLCGAYQVISTGLDPSCVSSELFTKLGELVAERSFPGGAWSQIYLYDGKYFILNEMETSVADTEAEAFISGGIDSVGFDEFAHSKVHTPTPAAQKSASCEKKATPNKNRCVKRAVLVVVTDWPGGTMAFKFGSAMRAALDVAKEDMSLLQMTPERIFRVETTVSEAEFREALGLRDVASGGRILFVEIPKK